MFRKSYNEAMLEGRRFPTPVREPSNDQGHTPESSPETEIESAAASAISIIESRVSVAKSTEGENPYRARSTFGYADLIQEDLYRSEVYGVYNRAMQKIDGYLRTLTTNAQEHPLFATRKKLVDAYSGVETSAGDVQTVIKQSEDSIYQSSLIPERGVENAFVTKRQIVEMNRATPEQSDESVWDAASVAKLSTEELVARMESQGSGRYFLHAFPEISLEKGHIANAIGGDALLGGFQVSRDRAGVINFTAEHGNEHSTQFYLQFGNGVGGGVLFPAEVLLQNYAFINLPYAEDLKWTSSEWRVHGPRNNPRSPLHVIPLNQGICFFRREDEARVNELVSQLPENIRPNKIVFCDGSVPDGLRDFLSKMKKPSGLPRTSRPIEIIATENGIPVFGTHKTKEIYSPA